MQTAFFEPFGKETGVEVVAAAAPSLAKVRAQVQSGDTGWDMVVPLVGWDILGGSKLWAAIDYAAIGMPSVPDRLRRPLAVTFAVGVGGICWDTQRNGARSQHPET
jgi:putative spermidine/putrescine transport system substrate-binding protein